MHLSHDNHERCIRVYHWKIPSRPKGNIESSEAFAVKRFTFSDPWGRTTKQGSRIRCLLISGLIHLCLLIPLQVLSFADQSNVQSVQFFASPPSPSRFLMRIPRFNSDDFLQSHSNSTEEPDSELEMATVSLGLVDRSLLQYAIGRPKYAAFPHTEERP